MRGWNKKAMEINLEQAKTSQRDTSVPAEQEKLISLALLAGSYMLKNGGDGYSMFAGAKLLQDEVMLDNQVLINYITTTLGGVVGEEYANPYGQGRIVAVPEAPAN